MSSQIPEIPTTITGGLGVPSLSPDSTLPTGWPGKLSPQQEVVTVSVGPAD